MSSETEAAPALARLSERVELKREPAVDGANVRLELSRNLVNRQAFGLESPRSIDPFPIVTDPAAGAAEESVGTLPRTRIARHFEGGAAMGGFAA